MQLNQLKRRSANKNHRPRVGRGGKRGTTAGHGTKGQKSRSGHRIRPAVRDLIQRLPKLRGHHNIPIFAAAKVITLTDLGRLKVATITKRALLEANLISSMTQPVKVLSQGRVEKALTIDGLPLSKSARAKIEKAGGKITS